MPGNRYALEKAIDLAPATDYPIVIANDDYYGGLGGRYAITTRSLTSGSMVLRHELGHNFGDVGEEYDGGYVYRGANFSHSPNVNWMHWLESNEELEVHRSKFLTGAYIWKNLKNGPFIKSFNFPDNGDHYFQMKISTVGWSSSEDVLVYLDDELLELDGVYTRDRSFFKTNLRSLSKGNHTIKIIEKRKDGDNVLAYANSYSYPKDYNFSKHKTGAFNVFDSGQRQRGYRPTHESCLMRDMRVKVFCSVDKENMWVRFLKKVSLIDDLDIDREKNRVNLKTVELDGLDIRWFKKAGRSWSENITARGKKHLDYSRNDIGDYKVKVGLKHSEIRRSFSSLTAEKSFSITR